MSQLRKRDREFEALQDFIDLGEPKRFHGEEIDHFLYLRQLDKTLVDDDDEEECAPSEELLNGVMRSLEGEIAATYSTYFLSSDSQGNSATSNGQQSETLDSDSGVDLCYLLETSDDDLGIPPSAVLDSKRELCLSLEETSQGLSEYQYLESLGENWHFKNFDNYEQFTLSEDPWDESQLQDRINRIFVSQSMLFDP